MLSPARIAAFDVLLRIEQQDAYASELLRAPRLERLSPADHGLCTEIVMGVLRWRMRLDRAIGELSSQPLHRLDDEVLTALRMAAYQLGFLQRVPAHAAINDSVELVKRRRKQSAAPFVNAVLRKLHKEKSAIEPLLAPDAKTAIDLAELYSHPLWLVERWAMRMGMEIAESICAYDQKPAPTAIHLRGDEVEQELVDSGVQLAPGKLLRSARRVLSGDVSRTRAFAEGRLTFQDEASQLVALLVGRGQRLLDCCAAPGGKTAMLAEQNPRSLILASDFRPARARLLRERLQASGAGNVRVVTADARQLPLRAEFDRVLADVPCSGTGTLGRHPEIKWRLQPSDLADLHCRQTAILHSSLLRLRSGGRAVYSTCSLEPEENVDVVEEVLGGGWGYHVISCAEELQRLRDEGEMVWEDLDGLCDGAYLRTLPGVHPCDAFFAAIVARD